MRKVLTLFFLTLVMSLAMTGYLYKNTDVRKRAAVNSLSVPKKLAIFQGYLKAIQTDLNEFDVIVLPMGAENPSDEDNSILMSKVSGLRNNGKEVFGYVDMGVNTQNLTITQAKVSVDRWMAMGVTGIFWDNCGYDAYVGRTRQIELVDYTHGKGLKVFLNAKEPNDIFYNAPAINFISGDYFLYEDFLVANNVIEPMHTWQFKVDKLMNYANQTGVKVAVVTTATDEKYKTAAWWGAAMMNAYAFGYSYPGYGAKDIGADTLFSITTVNSDYGTQFLDANIIHSADYKTHSRRTDKGIITLVGDGVSTISGKFTAQVVPTVTSTLKPTMTPTMTPAISVNNIIPNNSVETVSSNQNLPSNWDQDKWGTNNVTFSYLNSGAYDGSRALKVQINSISSGDAKWTFNSVPVVAGAIYKFSDWYQSNITSRVVVYVINKDLSESYLELKTAPASSVWTQYSTSFQMPVNAMQASVFHLIDKVAWLITDNYSLSTNTGSIVPTIMPTKIPLATNTPTKVPTQVPIVAPTKIPLTTNTPTKVPTVIPTSANINGNIIPNNSVETVSSNQNLPSNWDQDKWGTNNVTFSYLNSGAYDGSRALKVQINSISSGDAKWTFNSVPVVAGAIYKFSDWYQSNITSRVVLFYVNNDGSEKFIEMNLAPSSTTWKQYTAAFVVPSNAKTLSVFHLIDKVGWLITDAYNLTR